MAGLGGVQPDREDIDQHGLGVREVSQGWMVSGPPTGGPEAAGHLSHFNVLDSCNRSSVTLCDSAFNAETLES